jgi:hypothetical protein
MECLLPLERVSICRGIQQYVNDMKLLKSQQKENLENANLSANMSANVCANENAVENIKMEPNVDFKHQCVQCEKNFLTIVGMSQHMESAHPQSSENVNTMPQVNIKKRKKPGFKHQCLLCERRFLKKDALVQHTFLNHTKSSEDCVPTSEAASIDKPTAPVEASPAPIEGNYF